MDNENKENPELEFDLDNAEDIIAETENENNVSEEENIIYDNLDMSDDILKDKEINAAEEEKDEISDVNDEITPVTDCVPIEEEDFILEDNDSEITETSEIVDTDISESGVDSGIENNIEEEVNIKEKPKKKQKKSDSPEKKRKKKKLQIIAIAIAALLVILTISIVTPILVINKDKIFVSSADDFANVNKGNYYVLKKDIIVEGDLVIGNAYSIDLNNHTLTVNGKLVFNHNQSEGIIDIGTKKGKGYQQGGIVYAQEIELISNGKIEIHTPVTAETITIGNNNVNAHTNLHARKTLNINGGQHNFAGEVVFEEGGVANVNNSEVVFERGAKADFKAVNSKIKLSSGEMNSASLDGASQLRCYGKVNGDIIGGSLVLMGKESSADTIKDVNTLWITRDNGNIMNIINIDTIKYIEQLTVPSSVTVIVENNKIYCNVTKVYYAERYAFYIDDNEPVIVEDNGNGEQGFIECDITSYVQSAGNHNIKVIAMGAEGEEEFVLASEPIYYNYTHRIKLETVKNLVIVNKNADEILLQFNESPFADEYKVTINSTEIILRPDDATNGVIIFNIKEYLNEVGDYAISVQARSSKNADIESSETAITSYKVIKPHSKTNLTFAISEDGAKVTLSWDKIDTAVRYTVWIKSIDNVWKVYVLTPSLSIDIPTDLLTADTEFYVTVNANGYYTDSEGSNIVKPLAQ